ncbi:MAG: ribonuclease H-like domain-containing protein [Raineya sp.]|nr:ribonuclease H-like domain-containing protein [Raineya sp.]MDW8295898.1 ribonuclease H-like domain-containing protein [Raineya sp.]
MMFSKEQITRMLFLDIETATSTQHFHELSEGLQKMWEIKSQNLEPKDLSAEEKYYEKAAIYAEFGRVVCISCGFIYERNDQFYFKVKSFYGENEKEILINFRNFLNEKTGKLDNYGNLIDKNGRRVFDSNGNKLSNEWLFHYLVAHNGKEFDFPYLCRRYIVNQIALPEVLEIRGKKPWDILHLIDTMEMWRFGDIKSFTKLELLCHLFDIPTPKDDMDGSMVGKVFWQDKNLDRIAKYCEKDVVATAQIMLKFNFFDIFPLENVITSESNVANSTVNI